MQPADESAPNEIRDSLTHETADAVVHETADAVVHETADAVVHETADAVVHETADAFTHETANETMKRRSAVWLPRSIVLAVLLHAALFVFAPDMTTANEHDAKNAEVYVIPPEVEIPDPPAEIIKPAKPVAGSIDISTDVTITSTSFEAWTPDTLAPPPTTGGEDVEGFRKWLPSMVAPRLLNPEEVERELARTYPAIMRDAGVGGQVNVTLWLDEDGAIVKAEVGSSSGYQSLDDAALKVVGVMKLTPAKNRGRPVRVIVTLPVLYRVR
jgi:protein TonB